MHDEYALYSDGKVVVLADDGRLLLKPTWTGRVVLPAAEGAPSYPDGRRYLVIDDALEDAAILRKMFTVT